MARVLTTLINMEMSSIPVILTLLSVYAFIVRGVDEGDEQRHKNASGLALPKLLGVIHRLVLNGPAQLFYMLAC